MPVNVDFYNSEGFKILSPANKILQRMLVVSGGFSTTYITTKIPMFYGNTNVQFHLYSTANTPSDWYDYWLKTDVYSVTGSDDVLYFIHRAGILAENVAKTKTYISEYIGAYWESTLTDKKMLYAADDKGNITWSLERLKKAPYVVAVLDLVPNQLVNFTSPNNRRLHIMQSSIPGTVNAYAPTNNIAEWSGVAIKWSNNGKTVSLGYMGEQYKTAVEDLARSGGRIRIILLEYADGD